MVPKQKSDEHGGSSLMLIIHQVGTVAQIALLNLNPVSSVLYISVGSSELPVCETMEEEVPILHQKEYLKRRSSVFQRRSILLTATSSKTDELDETKTSNVISPTATPTSEEGAKMDEEIEEPFDLRAYIYKLKREKQDWQEIRHKRRTLHRNLVKKKAAIEESGQEVDLSILTESERNFVEARPNYEHIVKSSKDLVEMAVKLTILNKHCTQLSQRFHEKMEKNIKEATIKIISMVD